MDSPTYDSIPIEPSRGPDNGIAAAVGSVTEVYRVPVAAFHHQLWDVHEEHQEPHSCTHSVTSLHPGPGPYSERKLHDYQL